MGSQSFLPSPYEKQALKFILESVEGSPSTFIQETIEVEVATKAVNAPITSSSLLEIQEDLLDILDWCEDPSRITER